jgi:excinuclease ABC subunit A
MVEFLTLRGVRENNLRGIDFHLPLGVFTAITGPSGSGKSSLIDDVLFPVLARRLHYIRARPGRHDSVDGVRLIDKVIRVDQSPLGNTPSSNPATYTGAFDLIRQCFAELPESKQRHYTSRTFSFNVTGGRCEACEGSGQRRIEMHFLPDVWVTCETCRGRRYNDDVLEVRFHGHTIADVLELSCGDAVALFADHPRIVRILQTLCDVGLDYVTLGQAAPTLSGGEAQRVKLAAELARPVTGNTLYLLDEPTTGLHFDDIARLLGVLQRLVELGNTLVVIEHNLDVIKCADWIVDLGPGAGSAGGEIVFAGTPEQLADTAGARGRGRGGRSRRRGAGKTSESPTAPFLAEALRTSAAASTEPDVSPTGPKPAVTATEPPRTPPGRLPPSSTMHPAPTGLATELSPADPSSSPAGPKTPVTASTPAATGVHDSPPSAQSRPANHNGEVTAVQTPQVAVIDPWRALGRKWHCLGKGFPEARAPQWPLELADATLRLLEEVAGGQSLAFEAPDRVDVRTREGGVWVRVATKDPESVKLTVSGPREAVDVDLLLSLGLDGPVQLGEDATVRVTLNLTDPGDVRSRKLKAFLARHWERIHR